MNWQYEYNGRLYDYHWYYQGQEKLANWVDEHWDHHKKQWVKARLHVVIVG